MDASLSTCVGLFFTRDPTLFIYFLFLNQFLFQFTFISCLPNDSHDMHQSEWRK